MEHKCEDDLLAVKNSILNIEMLNNKSILITGSTGLIGSALIDMIIYLNTFFKSNIHIYAAGRDEDKIKDRFNKYYGEEFFTIVNYDSNLDINFDFRVDYIIHAASNAHPLAYSKEPVETMISNFIGLNNLLNYAKNNGVKRTLFISSSEVYGEKKDKDLYKEEDYGYVDILNPRASYPSSKRAAETLCVSYKKEYDLDVVIVRPGHIYGPTITNNDSRVSAQFTRNVLNGEDIIMKSSGLQLRSYCYVFDCVSAIFTVLLNGESGEAYNISNKESIVTIRQLAETFANITGCKIIYENPSDMELSGYNMMQCSALDSEKIESLGWSAVYNIENGVKRTIESLNCINK